MIIKELYVDHFLENDDLTLADLSDQLNVIRVPSKVETDFLHAFIPSMLYGDADRSASGSALIEIGPQLFELLRIGEGEMAGLHVLDEQGETTDDPLKAWLQQLTAETYLAVFTDHLLISDRLEQWQRSGLIDIFIDEESGPPAAAKIDDSSLTAEIGSLKQQIKRLARQRSQVLLELTSGPDSRDDYLNARSIVGQAEVQVEQISSQLERHQQRMKPIELALQIVKPWQRQSKLNAQIEELRALNVRPKDLTRLQRVERQLTESRALLRELREQVNDPDAEPVVAGFDAESQRLLSQREEALLRLGRCEQLQQELADASHAEQREQGSVDDAIQQLKDVASRLSDARRHFREATRHARQMAQDEDGDVSIEGATSQTEFESVEEIRQRIKQLRAETHQLLKRRLLPPLIVLILGVVFAIGATCLMAALLLDLNGFDSSVGAIGVTAMLAAALLKLSFERPPDHQLKAHRERIQRLLKEIQQRDLTEQSTTGTDDSIPIPIVEPVTPRIVTPVPDESDLEPPQVDPRIRQELENAYQEWVTLLGQYDLDPEIALQDALAEVRQRHTEQISIQPDQSSTLHLEQDDHHRWLDRYRKSLMAFLAIRRRPTDRSTLDDADWDSLFSLLEDEAHSVPAQPAPSVDPSSPEQIADVQRQIKKKKQSRDKILQRTGAKDADDLKSQLERKERLSGLETELHRVQQRIRRELGKVDYDADVKRLLESKSDADLKKHRSRKQADIKRLSAQLKEAKSELDSAMMSVQKLSSDPSKIDLRLQLNLIGEQLVVAAEQLRVAQIGRQTVGQLQPPMPAGGRPSAAMEEASRLLQATRKLPCRILYDADQQQFHFVDESEVVIPVREMGRNAAEQIVLCLQLALVRYLHEESGIRLPLVLHERSLGYPAEHALQTGRLLSGVAAEGTQTFLFSCHESVSDLFNQFGVPSLVVERTVASKTDVQSDYYPDQGEVADDVIELEASPDLPESNPIVEPGPSDWIPVEYHVVDTREPDRRETHQRETHQPDPAQRDPAQRELGKASETPISQDLAAKLEQLERPTSGQSKKYRIDRPHTDRPMRPPTPRRWSVSAGDDELPDWWPD